MNINIKEAIVLAVGALAVGTVLVIMHQHYVVIPQLELEQKAELAEQARLEALKESITRQARYNSCTDTAYENYSANWDSKCEIEGKAKDCTLPAWQSDWINERFEKEQDKCVELYKSY